MNLTSKNCRDQEAAQQARADNDPLPNVRILAAKAAAVWRNEGRLAEKREQRHQRGLTVEVDAEDDFSGPDPDEYVPPNAG